MAVRALSNLSGFAVARHAIAALGLAAALIAGAYKGVLFSTTAQPGWKEARWLGAELSISSGAAGTAFLLAAVAILRAPRAFDALRAALAMLLLLEAAAALAVRHEMRRALSARFTRAELSSRYAGLIGGGLFAPLVLLMTSRDPSAAVVAALMTLAGAIAMRHHLVAIVQRDPRPVAS